eukprot:357690-Amorphochlora_amoeboformis.AAC.1
MATLAAKPKKAVETQEKVSRIRITLSSRKVKALEKGEFFSFTILSLKKRENETEVVGSWTLSTKKRF